MPQPSPPDPLLSHPTRTYRTPRTFHPAYSLLGRWVRHLAGDRLRGEAYYLVAVTGLTLLVLLAHYATWAAVEPYLAADPETAWLSVYGWAQVASAGLVALVGLVGFRPGVEVTCDAEGEALHAQQGARQHTIAYAAIQATEVVPANLYHQHYRRYAAVRPFVGTVRDEVLLVRTDDAILAIGLASAEDHRAVQRHLTQRPAPAPAS